MISGDRRAETARGASIPSGVSSSAMLAHELKSPLALIRQLTFELGSPDIDQEEKRELTEQIRLTSERALRFASNITRSELSQQELFDTTTLSSTAICREVVEESQPLYKAHGRTFEFRKHSRDYLAVANPDLLHRILMNFADNALEYSDPASVVEIYIALQRKSERVRLGVRDRKKAITIGSRTVSKQPKLYDRHGIGLAIAHNFAQQFGGEIGASRHRDGMSFYVDLNLSKQLMLV
jgi:signal transduction histidine kinase